MDPFTSVAGNQRETPFKTKHKIAGSPLSGLAWIRNPTFGSAKWQALPQRRPLQNNWSHTHLGLLLTRTSGDTEGAGIWGDSPWHHFPIKLRQGEFVGNPPLSLVAPVSLLVPPVNIPIPTKMTKMDGAPKTPKWDPIGFDQPPYVAPRGLQGPGILLRSLQTSPLPLWQSKLGGLTRVRTASSYPVLPGKPLK